MKKEIKKLLCMGLSLVLAAGVTGCNSEKKETSTNQTKKESTVSKDNLIKNGDFSNGKEGFALYTNGGSATMDVNDDGQLVVSIKTVGGVEHGVQVYCDGFKLNKDGVYKLDFDVKSSEDIYFDWRFQINGGDYHAYATDTVKAGSEEQHISEEFTMTEDSDPAPRFCFNMGYVQAYKDEGIKSADVKAHDVTIDNISLTIVDDSKVEKQEEGPDVNPVRVNQLGYRPDAYKNAVIGEETSAKEFSLVDAKTGDEVYKADLLFANDMDKEDEKFTGEKNAYADFSDYKTEGNYKIKVGDFESEEFEINDDVYDDILDDSLKMLYLQRCGCKLEEEYAGDFAHDLCHDKKAVYYGTKKKADVSGGWHDAGDYGRYIVSGAKAAADLMLAYEHNPDVFDDDLGIPESGNSIPDILDEVKYELDWFFKMQDENGGVHHKVTCKMFPDFVMPEEETDELIICDVSKTATGDFAAVMAMAARIYKDIDKDYADKCLKAAEKAYEFIRKKGDKMIGFKNPPEVVTGEYPDGNGLDEKLFAAVELLIATGDSKYQKEIEQTYADMTEIKGLGWADVGYYAAYDYLLPEHEKCVPKEGLKTYTEIQEEFASSIETSIMISDMNRYNVCIKDGAYPWGSNMTILDDGILFSMGEDTGVISGEEAQKANEHMQSALHYVLGTNACGYCFVTGYGVLSPEHTHHRPSQSLGITMKGMLAGGVDSALEDPYAKGVLSELSDAKRYADNEQSYSCNEVTVYWNSPLVWMLAINK